MLVEQQLKVALTSKSSAAHLNELTNNKSFIDFQHLKKKRDFLKITWKFF